MVPSPLVCLPGRTIDGSKLLALDTATYTVEMGVEGVRWRPGQLQLCGVGRDRARMQPLDLRLREAEVRLVG